MKKAVVSLRAPKAIGPYSQAIALGDLLYISGQIPADPASGEMLNADIAQATDRVLKNIQAVLEAAGMEFCNVIKTTVYMKNLADFAGMNEVYAQFFKEPYPARATIEVSQLPKGALVEIEAVAARSGT